MKAPEFPLSAICTHESVPSRNQYSLHAIALLASSRRRPPPAVFADHYPRLAHNESEEQTDRTAFPSSNGCRHPLVAGIGARLGQKRLKNIKNVRRFRPFFLRTGELSIHNLPLTKYGRRNKGELNSVKTARFCLENRPNLRVLGNF
jgi:hypothetical protein